MRGPLKPLDLVAVLVRHVARLMQHHDADQVQQESVFRAHLYLTTSITASCSALAFSLSNLCWHGRREVENSASLIKQLWVQTPTQRTIFQIWHFNWAISASPATLTSEDLPRKAEAKSLILCNRYWRKLDEKRVDCSLKFTTPVAFDIWFKAPLFPVRWALS